MLRFCAIDTIWLYLYIWVLSCLIWDNYSYTRKIWTQLKSKKFYPNQSYLMSLNLSVLIFLIRFFLMQQSLVLPKIEQNLSIKYNWWLSKFCREPQNNFLNIKVWLYLNYDELVSRIEYKEALHYINKS